MRDTRERVLDILEALERIEKYSHDGRLAFEQNELVQVWVLHHLQILGEAVNALRPEFQQGHPEVPWTSIVGMRNILVPIPEAPLALLADPPSPWVAVPGLVIFSAAMLALSAWKVRKMEISYEEDKVPASASGPVPLGGGASRDPRLNSRPLGRFGEKISCRAWPHKIHFSS